ncbi:TPA: chemotaxis response regulator protein-glutamate methylesterase [Vibrio vulnificus]|uniref:Protein-glutamate methylesterase/protein-glutamine glutaminase n=2 Tax=Vibrio vulnificus TaxID=672 RepID=A0A8H9K9E2_VIBVL|nr:chemotaxis response regulator protein-glutamate methylesterase [Vibrio vulnificus]
MMSKKIKVLVVDDSPVFRALLSEIINSDPQLEVIGAAEDPYQAREMIKALKPDVLTLDIEMPKMNGVQFLKNLMRLHPLPVVMISTLTQHGADATLMALELGAVDYFPKPSVANTADMLGYRSLVNEKIRMAAQAQVGANQSMSPAVASSSAVSTCQYQLIAIGASTGGTEAVKHLLSALPASMPPIVITQHISAMFSGPFASRLDASCALSVSELTQGEVALKANHAYVAPGDKHLMVFRRGGQLYAHLDDSPAVNRHKPSVDVMFGSVAESLKGKAIGVILTGMGKDGAQGMLQMKQQGAITVAQDEQSCVVYGMPRAAVECGAAMHVKPLNKLPQFLCDLLS